VPEYLSFIVFFILTRGQRIPADGLEYDVVQRSWNRSALSRKYRLWVTRGLTETPSLPKADGGEELVKKLVERAAKYMKWYQYTIIDNIDLNLSVIFFYRLVLIVFHIGNHSHFLHIYCLYNIVCIYKLTSLSYFFFNLQQFFFYLYNENMVIQTLIYEVQFVQFFPWILLVIFTLVLSRTT